MRLRRRPARRPRHPRQRVVERGLRRGAAIGALTGVLATGVHYHWDPTGMTVAIVPQTVAMVLGAASTNRILLGRRSANTRPYTAGHTEGAPTPWIGAPS